MKRSELLAMSPTEIFLARSIEYCNDLDVLDWARSSPQLHGFVDADDAYELLTINSKRADQLRQVPVVLENLIRKYAPNFHLSDPSAEAKARALFEARLRDYVDESCRPWDVCSMVSPIEQLFDYPDWLGNMYNLCDWLGPSTEPVDCRHLMDGIKAHLSELS